MSRYFCHMDDVDDENEWRGFESAIDAEMAAVIYAERCDSKSAGEIFSKPDLDFKIVRVKDADGKEEIFTVTFEYKKTFYARKRG